MSSPAASVARCITNPQKLVFLTTFLEPQKLGLAFGLGFSRSDLASYFVADRVVFTVPFQISCFECVSDFGFRFSNLVAALRPRWALCGKKLRAGSETSLDGVSRI